MVAVAARMPATEIEAYEDDTRLHFDVESDFPRFLDSVFQRTDQISQTKVDEEIMEQHQCSIMSLSIKRRICFLYPGIPRNSSSNINAYDIETSDNLLSAYSDVLSALHQCLARAALSPTTIVCV